MGIIRRYVYYVYSMQSSKHSISFGPLVFLEREKEAVGWHHGTRFEPQG